jgi:hypothetical protein
MATATAEPQIRLPQLPAREHQPQTEPASADEVLS